MKSIYIVGAGGLGKEVFILIEDINFNSQTFEIKGFLDSDKRKKHVKIGTRIIEVFDEERFLEENSQNSNINLAIAIGSPIILKKVTEYYKENTKFVFPNLIHPSVQYRIDTLHLIEGNIISANTFISTDVTLGSFNIINLNCTIGHDTKIDNFNVINPGVNLSGGVTIGSQNLFGTNSTIIQYLCIGNQNVVSAASFIAKSIENDQVLMGNPARVISLNK